MTLPNGQIKAPSVIGFVLSSHLLGPFFVQKGINPMKEIPLSQGLTALVDDEDFDELSKYHWYACKCRGRFYARRKTKKNRKSTTFYMHREIIKTHLHVDHWDGNGLNNQRKNLRPCTESQNQMNRRAQSNSVSGYKGVSWHTRTGKWRATIRIGGKHRELGFYRSKEEAAIAYNEAASQYFGEFSLANKLHKPFQASLGI
jgi:hypothetical protein